MDRSSILKLRESRWVRLFDELDLEVELIPSEMPDLSMTYLGVGLDQLAKEVCSRAFVNFKNYEEDGKAVPNTLDARMELYGVPVLRARINTKLQEANAEVVTGEADAASD